MKINMVFDSKKLERKLSKMQKSMPKVIDRALIQTAQFGTNVILDRTAKGVGYSGKFKPYTPEYFKRKGQGWASIYQSNQHL